MLQSLKYFFIALALAAFSLSAQARGVLPLTVDLSKNAVEAKERKIPIVIFATATWCGYCKKLEQNIINPLLETTEIEKYAEFSQLVLDKSGWNVILFDGTRIEMSKLGDQLGVMVAPTTIFLDHEGNQIAEPILGLTLEEFYPSNLERQINIALEKLGNPMRLDIYKMVGKEKPAQP